MTDDTSDGNRREWIAFAGDLTSILVAGADTGGSFGLLATRKPAGGITPIHEHARESETVYVLSGELSAQTVEGVRTLRAGDVATLPSCGRHRLANQGGTDARYLLLCQPAGFEDFVAEAGGVVHGDLPDFVPPNQTDIARLIAVAPRYAITLLGPDALPEITDGPQLPPSFGPLESIDAIGIGIDVLAELGSGDDAVALIRAIFQPGTVIPLHSHAEPELFYVVEGLLEIYRDEGAGAGAGWVRLGAGEIGRVSPDVPHAVRNVSHKPAVALTVTTGRLLRFLRAIARPADAPRGPPTTDEIMRMVGIADGFGHWNAAPSENAAIGLTADSR